MARLTAAEPLSSRTRQTRYGDGLAAGGIHRQAINGPYINLLADAVTLDGAVIIGVRRAALLESESGDRICTGRSTRRDKASEAPDNKQHHRNACNRQRVG